MQFQNDSYRISHTERDFLRMLFQHSPIVYFEFNRFLRLSFINKEGISFSGYRPDDKIYRLADFVEPEKIFRSHWKEGHSRNLTEVRIKKENGNTLYLNCLWWVIQCEGKFDGIAGLGFDSTQYHQMMEEIGKSNLQFKEFAQLLPETVFEVDFDGNFLFLNESSYKLFGYTKNDKINAFDMIVPQDRPRVKENIKKILAGETFKGNAYLAKRKDGSTFPVLIYSDVKYRDGKPVGFIGLVVDISSIRIAEEALLESEEKYRSLTNRLPVGIYRTSRDGKILFANPAFVKMLGFNSPEELFVHPVQDFYVEPGEREKLLQHLKPGKEYYQSEIHLKKKDGTHIIAKDRGKVYRSPDGQIYYDGIIEDATETHQLEERLKQAEKLQAIGTLAGGIAHDFNNLLMGMQLYTEMALKEAGDNDKLRKNLEKILLAQERGKQLLEQIVSFTNYPDEQREIIDLKETITHILDLIKDTIPETITFETELNDCGFVNVNPVHLHQIIQNLITNAIHAMEGKGKLTIIVRCAGADETTEKNRKEKDRDHYAIIHVEDNGCGINENNINRIFEPFFTTKDVGLGTGLGLYIVHNLVKKYNGEIQVKSHPGEGTVFEVFLPLVVTKKKRLNDEADIDS